MFIKGHLPNIRRGLVKGTSQSPLKTISGLFKAISFLKGPYPLGYLCRIGAGIGARIGHQWQILAAILAAIPVVMLLGNWPNTAGQNCQAPGWPPTNIKHV